MVVFQGQRGCRCVGGRGRQPRRFCREPGGSGIGIRVPEGQGFSLRDLRASGAGLDWGCLRKRTPRRLSTGRRVALAHRTQARLAVGKEGRDPQITEAPKHCWARSTHKQYPEVTEPQGARDPHPGESQETEDLWARGAHPQAPEEADGERARCVHPLNPRSPGTCGRGALPHRDRRNLGTWGPAGEGCSPTGHPGQATWGATLNTHRTLRRLSTAGARGAQPQDSVHN